MTKNPVHKTPDQPPKTTQNGNVAYITFGPTKSTEHEKKKDTSAVPLQKKEKANLLSYNVPEYNSESFINRPEKEEKIAKELSKKGSRVAVLGCAGSGKSTICSYIIRKWPDNYDRIFWLNASSKDTLNKDFCKLLYSNDIITIDKNYNDASALEKSQLIEAFYHKLDKSKTLLIFDNAPARRTINTYLPAKEITVLVISIYNSWGKEADFQSINMGSFSQEQAIEYLKKTFDKNKNYSQESIIQLVDAVENLPLALAKVTEHMQRNRRSLDYCLNKITQNADVEKNSFMEPIFKGLLKPLTSFVDVNYSAKMLELLGALAYADSTSITEEFVAALFGYTDMFKDLHEMSILVRCDEQRSEISPLLQRALRDSHLIEKDKKDYTERLQHTSTALNKTIKFAASWDGQKAQFYLQTLNYLVFYYCHAGGKLNKEIKDAFKHHFNIPPITESTLPVSPKSSLAAALMGDGIYKTVCFGNINIITTELDSWLKNPANHINKMLRYDSGANKKKNISLLYCGVLSTQIGVIELLFEKEATATIESAESLSKIVGMLKNPATTKLLADKGLHADKASLPPLPTTNHYTLNKKTYPNMSKAQLTSIGGKSNITIAINNGTVKIINNSTPSQNVETKPNDEQQDPEKNAKTTYPSLVDDSYDRAPDSFHTKTPSLTTPCTEEIAPLDDDPPATNPKSIELYEVETEPNNQQQDNEKNETTYSSLVDDSYDRATDSFRKEADTLDNLTPYTKATPLDETPAETSSKPTDLHEKEDKDKDRDTTPPSGKEVSPTNTTKKDSKGYPCLIQ